LQVADGVNVVRQWNNTLAPTPAGWTSPIYTWDGLDQDTNIAAGPVALKPFTLKLLVQPAPYGDLGYVPPPANIIPTTPVTIDNVNPTLVNGTGTSIGAQRQITLTSGIPVVTETENILQFNLYSSEFLPATIGGNGWNVQVLKSDNTPLMNAGNPVTASIFSITPSNGTPSTGYKNFNIAVTVNNLAGTLTNENTVLVVKAPWDYAGNPGRYNSPTYPYNADIWNLDSAEYYMNFHVLDAKPKITEITFTNKIVTGNATYVSGAWNPAATQSWVRDGGNPNGNFTMTATVTGGAYRAMHTDWTANLQTLLGGTGSTNTAVVPTSVSSGVSPNESLVWTLTWTGQIPTAVATPWTHGQTLTVPITIVTRDGANPIAHSETQSISIRVDKTGPVVSTGASSIVADGTPKALTFTPVENPGAGVYWNTVVNPYSLVGESLVLNPNTGMTITDTGDGTYTVSIPANSAVKYFTATYTVMDNMGNQTVYIRYLNVDPVPQISNVKINSDATWFVPGNNLVVTWDLANYQRATGVVITLTNTGTTPLTTYTQTISTGFAATMSYTYPSFFLNNVGLDGKVLTATVTGYTTGYTSPSASATANRAFTYSGNSDPINVDTKPVITTAVFKYNGVNTNVILPTMSGVQIVATVTSTDNANTANFPITITMNGVTGTFNLPVPAEVQTTNGSVRTRTYTWDNVSFANLTWAPVSDYKVADFVFNCQTNRGYAATPYTHQMGVLSNPTTLIQGLNTARTPYNNIDPDGWFAPEHLLSTQYTFVSTVNQTNPPIVADFDLIEDNIVLNLKDPIPVGQTNGSTKQTLTIPLTQGGSATNATAYKYVAKWRIQPDVQSVWNAYDDGEATTIGFAYQQLTGEVPDSRSIKVDKEVPVYDTQQLWVATGTAVPADWNSYFVNGGFNQPITLALTTSGSWPTSPSTQKIYLKYRAKDGVGVGVIDVANPTLSLWTVAQISHTDLGQGVVEKVISLTPTNPNGISATTVVNLMLAKIQDSVGHVNYGLPVNSTDPDWTEFGPVLTFGFSSDYLVNTEYAIAYQYVNGDRLDDYTAPYVKKGANFGFKMKLQPPARGVDVANIQVSGIDLNTYYVTNATGTGTTWTALAPHADGSYYLNTNIPVSTSYANGAGISLQYRVNYTITYTDNTTSTTSYLSPVIPNKAIVDAVSPVITSVQIWSESLGISQEGYVVPFDQNGVLEIKFTEIGGYADPTTVPLLTVSNLTQFVSSRNGIPMVSPYIVPADAFSFANGVWTATLNNLVIVAPVPPTNSVTIAYSVTDPVGNLPHTGNRMVEVAADGPIVPIIRYAELLTTLPDSQVVSNYIAQGVPAVLKVYIDTQYQAYIEQVWANAITGVSYGTPTIVEDLDPTNNYRWIATIPVTPTAINGYTTINFVVNTKRNPFGSDVFQDDYTIPVIVDGNNFIIANPAVIGVSSYMQIPGMINPAVDAIVTADFNLIGEQIATGTPGDPATLPDNTTLASWFTLQNTNPVAFTTIPTPVVTGTGNIRTVTWNFGSADINQALAADVTQLAINFQYRNVYGLTKTSANVNFDVDRGDPVISADGIKFYTGNTLTQTNSFSANHIANNQDWTKVSFELNDPALRVGVAGSGLNNAIVTLTRAPETYVPNPDPLANVSVTPLANGIIELAFTNGFSAYDLAEGFYYFNITVVDNLENDGTYVQQLLYWHSPSQIVIYPAEGATVNVMLPSGLVNQQQITAFPYDENGQVQGVHFHLYQDANDNSEYAAADDPDRTSDITPADSNPDMLAPYTVMWDMSADHYKYLVDPVYGRNATRKFLVRASAISEGRSVTDTIVVVNVVDNQPPVPNAPTYSGNTTFDYQTPANNAINLVATFNAEWIDAEWVTFDIYSGSTLIQSINSLVVAGVADTTWNYNGQAPGEYTVMAKGKDFVGNVSGAVAMTLPITINNPASLIAYNLVMTNVIGFGNEPVIPNNTVYGFNNPVTAVGDLRLDAGFYNVNTMLPSLDGIASITFKARVTNNITGVVTTVDVPNDTTLQPDYPASGPIVVTPQMWNNTVTIFVPDSFYMPAGYAANDVTYEFFLELAPTDDVNLQAPNYSVIRLDYFAPRVAITSSTPNVTWSRENFFQVTGDIVDIQQITMMWSKNNVDWFNAVSNAPTFNMAPNTTHYAQFDNWNTAGGSPETLLDYAGPAWVKVIATDAMGNIRESATVQPFIDNVAPTTPVTHVAYRTLPDVEADAQGAYNNLHTLGSLTGEANNTITVVSSTQDYGTSSLRIYVDPAQITNLSNVAMDDADFNTFASWYTGTNDFRPPVRLYHGYSATGDVNNITWSNGVLYDHEPLNGLYGFDVPSTTIQASGTHYFILGVTDTRGNVEGDFANDGLPTAIAFDGVLSPEEKLAAIDLTVNVINVADVQMQIVSHVDNQIVGEWINLAANVTENIGNVAVDQVRFEYKVGNTWTPIATVASAQSSAVKFHLYRKDIPQYDGLPNVPGVHLYNAGGSAIAEMLWNAADGSWEYTATLAQGNYDVQYRLDLNNDGIINSLDLDVANALGTTYIIPDPNHTDDPNYLNGYTSFTVTPWVTPLNTEIIAAGLYEFRAVPLTAVGGSLFNQVSPSRWIHIDNNAPNTTITLIGGVQRIVPVTQQVTIVADVNELLVATDDIVEVMYQYASQPVAAPIRRWFPIGTQVNMGGNYQQGWVAPAPLTDLVDNDNDGLVDEADEADATFYLRAVARDKAGNYYTSNVYTLFVDGSAPQMLVDHINGVIMNSTNNIFVIPATGDVTVTANNITMPNFDSPVMVHFEYQYKASVNNAWSGWQHFDAANQWIPVIGGSASQVLSYVAEGYYGFRATGKDALGNIDANAPVTYVVFNDVIGSNAHITQVGSSLIISDEYGFSQTLANYAGTIQATIDDPQDVNTVTFEWAEAMNGPWTNINTLLVAGQGNVSTNWNPPVLIRAPYIYLRVVAQDVNGNNEAEQIVKLYLDTVAPGVVINQFTTYDASGIKWLNNTEAVNLNISYTGLPEVDLVDVAATTVRIVNTQTGLTIAETYQNVNQASQNFEFTALLMASLPDGIYRLEFVVTDFAGNTATILPAEYQALYIDTQIPAPLSIVSTTHPNNIAVYNTDAIEFEITYDDLIGIAPTGAMTATFTYMSASDVVDTYVLDTINKTITFTWNPEEDFENYIINGEMNIMVSAVITVTDLLGQEATVPGTTDFFALTYGVPNTTRMMAITDVVNGNRIVHFVNWNLTPGQVVELVGTNHTSATPEPLELYAYVPHLSEIPNSIDFSYRMLGNANWTMIATDINGEMWNFVDTSFFAQYQRQYSADWDISSLIGGIYEVKTTSNYISGSTESIAIVNIYNGTIIPQVTIDGIVNGDVQRGETYTLTAPTFIGNTSLLQSVVYKYRYVTVNNNVVSPVSQWMYFGDVNGVEQPAWIPNPYTFDWTIYPYYLYNNTVQIVAYAKDKWGTETPITNIIGNNAYAIAHITDTIAPAVAAIDVNWNAMLNPDWLSGIIALTATVQANVTTNIAPSDLDRVEFYLNNVLIATETDYQTTPGSNNIITQAYQFNVSADPAVTTAELKVMAYDVIGNVSTMLKTINIDNTLPTATLAVTQNGQPVTTLEREAELVLNANPADAPSGVQKVQYYYAYDSNVMPILIGEAVEAPWTVEWTVPANLEFGHDYRVIAAVTDMVGHVFEVEQTYEVSDTNTQILIVSVAGHAPVNHIIPVRLHGDFPVVTTVPADQNIPRLAWYIRSGEAAWDLLNPIYVTELFDYTTVLNLDTMPSGVYTLGVGPADRFVTGPVDWVTITVDNTISVSINGSVPATNGFFNGDSFVVNFSMTSDDEILEGLQNQVILSYAYPMDPTNWIPLGNANMLTTLNGVDYTATFENIAIMHNGMFSDGYYLFQISVPDMAMPTPNMAEVTVATNVMYDTTDPNVTLTSINGVTDLTLPVNINLGVNPMIEASAYDVLGGQIHQVSSGIQKLEFYYNYNGNEVMIGEDTTAPYSINWNTLGLVTGTYDIVVMAYDNAGNMNQTLKQVNITPPATWEPFALITAMNFDGDNANQDVIYMNVDTWNSEMIEAVALEYFNGTVWTQFAQSTDMTGYWKAQFNAELMTTVTKIRTVVTYNGGLISTNKPELNVAYNTAMGGSLAVTNPSIQANVFYNDEVRVTGAVSAPVVTTIYDDTYVDSQAAIMVNGNSTVFFDVPAHGVYNFWAAAVDYNTWMMQLNKTTLNTYNIGTVAQNGISVPVENGFVYFENVQPIVALPTGFTGLSAQNAVIAEPVQNLTYTVTLTSTPAAQGTVVGMYYDGAAWINVPATVAGNTASFTAPSGFIYAVAQYTGTAFNVMFSAIDPQYVNPATQLWTVEDPTSISFFVYDGMNQGGYTSPAAGDVTCQMYLDSVAIPATYNNGYITASSIPVLAAGAHSVSVVVTMNDVSVNASKSFNVDITVPVIVATGTQLTITNRTISATINDTQTGINDAYIMVTGWGNNSMTIPMENLVVNGSVYSYTFTMDDLNALGYDFYTSEMQATWYACNNLNMNTNTQPINYTVNIEGPAIAFTGFANGLWLNPTFNTPLTFTVTVPAGRTMPTDGVWIDLDEVTSLGDNQIQYMTLAPVSVAGNVYSYSFNFGQLLSPLATAVKLTVEAMDNYNVYNESQQTYGIDMAAPVVWALAPVGAPIDNDGDGLFNEDPPNGVNEDLDWVDLDQDGFWDAGEPQIVDEDPIDYYAAVIPQGTNVVVALAFEDYSGIQYLVRNKGKNSTRTTDWYYTGASGIDTANIQVSLNGDPLTGTITNGTFTAPGQILESGHYTVVASVPDVVGNVGSLAFEFDVVGGAPTIVFNPLAGGTWWLNTVDANTITFEVNSASDLANGGVVATFYAEPSNMVIQGPITPTGVAGVYTVTLLGGIVPADQMAVRLEVVATDVWGGVSTSNQTYGIDNNAPVITLTSPAENAQFNLNATVNIMATISDMVATRLVGLRNSNDGKDRPAGSGILSATLSVIAPDGTDAFEPITYPANTQVISKPMVATQYGTYIINLLAKDSAGNQSMVTRNFIVTPNSGPGVSFTDITWLNSVGINNLDFTVTSPVPVTVTANVFTYPSEALLMGPLNVSPVGGVYTVVLNGGMIPPNATSVKLQVIVTDQFGNVTEANYYYSVDRTAPVVTILNPVNGAEITYVDDTTKVRIDAQFSDLAPMLKGGAKSSNGSGIASSRMVIIDPLGLQVGAPIDTGIGVTETTHELTNLMLGTYTVRITVWDIAGNQAFASVNFTVIAAPLPPVTLEIDSAYAYPNPMASDGTARFSITLSSAAYVSVRIYDFAGRELRCLEYNSKVEGKAKADIVFDGCNNEGEKLARGTYFARVIANDGKKIVEKIVKIAIKK